MIRRLALAAALAAQSAVAQEPLSMRGLTAAAKRVEVLAQFPDMVCAGNDCAVVVYRICGNVGVVDEDTRSSCAAKYRYGGVTALSWSARFFGDDIEHLQVSIPGDDFPAIVDALRERFGMPQIQRDIYLWRRDEAELTASRRADRGHVFLFNLNAIRTKLQLERQRGRDAAKERAKDL